MPIIVESTANAAQFLLELSPMAAHSGAQMRYTLDDSPVTPQSTLYVPGEAIRIPAGGALRAASFAQGCDPSREAFKPAQGRAEA